jgi:hypothetical protein
MQVVPVGASTKLDEKLMFGQILTRQTPTTAFASNLRDEMNSNAI